MFICSRDISCVSMAYHTRHEYRSRVNNTYFHTFQKQDTKSKFLAMETECESRRRKEEGLCRNSFRNISFFVSSSKLRPRRKFLKRAAKRIFINQCVTQKKRRKSWCIVAAFMNLQMSSGGFFFLCSQAYCLRDERHYGQKIMAIYLDMAWLLERATRFQASEAFCLIDDASSFKFK